MSVIPMYWFVMVVDVGHGVNSLAVYLIEMLVMASSIE